MVKNEFYTNVKRRGNTILCRGRDSNGESTLDRVAYRPKAYTLSKHTGKYKTIHGEPLEAVHFDSMSEYSAFVKTYEGVPNFDIHGNARHASAFIQERFPARDVEYDEALINIVKFDIETDYKNGDSEPNAAGARINSIAFRSSKESGYRLWALIDGFKKPKDCIKYHYFDNERDMLQSFVDHWVSDYPDVITGWNSEFFDIPYIVNRISRVLGQKEAQRLSPWGIIKEDSVSKFGREQVTYDIWGVSSLDYMALYKKFSFTPQPSYKLDHIAEDVLGEKKIDYSEYGDLDGLYKKNPQLYLEYNIHDVRLIDRLEEKLGMIKLVLKLSYLTGSNYSDCLGTVTMWDNFIHRRLMETNTIVPPSRNHQRVPFEGAYVKEPHVGMHKWVMTFDLTSLYPHIIMQYNMSPETIVDQTTIPNVSVDYLLREEVSCDEPNLAMTANGVCFRKDIDGIIPTLVKEVFDARKAAKDKMIALKKSGGSDIEITEQKTLQMALKVAINSLYGAMGNIYFRYFDLRIAEGITLTGQTVIRRSESALNDFMGNLLNDKKDRVVLIDTDSCGLNCSDLMKKLQPQNPIDFLDKFASEGVEPQLKKAFDEFAKQTNAMGNLMHMKREIISDRMIIQAKKRYIMNVLDDEGVRLKEPKMKIMGIEAIKSSTPKTCQEAMKKLFTIIMTSTEKEAQSFVKEFRKEFESLQPHEIALTMSANDLPKYADRDKIYKKGVTQQARASLLYNHYLSVYNIDTHEKFQSGEKVKIIKLKIPNPIKENVIGFVNELPPEFGLCNYIDYEKQFDDVFLKPMKSITGVVGWNVEEITSLESFFA